jgi:hypothetical protein
MMVGALADTASEGGGIGLSELILQAMLPPAPPGKPDLSLHAASPEAGASAGGSVGMDEPQIHARIEGREDLSGVARGAVGDPAESARWGAPSRVLTEARPGPMLEGGARALGAAREGSGR